MRADVLEAYAASSRDHDLDPLAPNSFEVVERSSGQVGGNRTIACGEDGCHHAVFERERCTGEGVDTATALMPASGRQAITDRLDGESTSERLTKRESSVLTTRDACDAHVR
jgi:hypothetical protein